MVQDKKSEEIIDVWNKCCDNPPISCGNFTLNLLVVLEETSGDHKPSEWSLSRED